MSARFVSGKGVNKDAPPFELEPGYWSDMLNFRTRNGFDEKFEGATSRDTGATITAGSAAFLFPFDGTSGEVVVYGNNTKAYTLAFGTHSEITRYRKSETISTLNRIGANTAEVTTSSAHGLSTGDTVTVFGATEAGYNVSQVSITVMSTTVFRYTTTVAIAANATVVGQYVVYLATIFSDFQLLPTYPTGGVLNGIFFLYGPVDGLFYWAGDPSVRVRQVPFAVESNATAVRPFKNYLVMLNGRSVSWTDAAEPGAIPTTFTAAATNDAGSVPLAETNGYLVDCFPLGDVNIVYKDDSRYAMQYVGGNDVFRFTRLPGNDGLYRPWCVADTPVGHVFVTQDLDIKLHQGGAAKSIAEGRIRKYFASQFDIASKSDRIYLCVNPEKAEVWVCFATSSSSRWADKAIVWNWESDAWGIFSLSALASSSDGIAFGASGTWPDAITTKKRLLLANTSFDLLMVDSTATSNLTGTLERTGLDAGDRDTIKNLQRSRWNLDGTSGDVATIYHGSSMTADGTTSWTAGSSYTLGTTDMANGRANGGRFIGVKLSTTANNISLRSFDIEATNGGKR